MVNVQKGSRRRCLTDGRVDLSSESSLQTPQSARPMRRDSNVRFHHAGRLNRLHPWRNVGAFQARPVRVEWVPRWRARFVSPLLSHVFKHGV